MRGSQSSDTSPGYGSRSPRLHTDFRPLQRREPIPRSRRRSIHSPTWPLSTLSSGQPGAVSIKCRRVHASPKQSSGPNNCTNAQASSSVTGALTFDSCSSNACIVGTVAVAERGNGPSLRSALIASCIFHPTRRERLLARVACPPGGHSGMVRSIRPGISRFPDPQLRI